MSKQLQLTNGWRSIKDDPPPEEREVLVTNSPTARDARGCMSHIWISHVYRSGKTFIGWCGDQKIHGLIAWHPLPGNATANPMTKRAAKMAAKL